MQKDIKSRKKLVNAILKTVLITCFFCYTVTSGSMMFMESLDVQSIGNTESHRITAAKSGGGMTMHDKAMEDIREQISRKDFSSGIMERLFWRFLSGNMYPNPHPLYRPRIPTADLYL
jgi:hypothetical protein